MRAALLPALLIFSLVHAGPARAADAVKPRVVLVETDGRGEELDAFVARLESELSDGGAVTFSDARLAGGTLGSLMSEPDGEAARAFRKEWPGDVWIAASLSPCEVRSSRSSYWDTTPEGYRVERVIVNVHVECTATLRLVDAATAKERKLLTVTGTTSYRQNEGEEGETSELAGAREAAKKVAKKLPPLLKK